MTAIKLSTICVPKPWGRHDLWPGFENPASTEDPIGEIWFDAPAGMDPALMVKYLFTSERLSIQVHPDDVAARASGHPRGKDEAWIILAAEPDSTIALGTVRPLTRQELHDAALDGSIEELMHWQPVKAGDVIYSPAGVVHALGAGLTLVEVQQNVDLTYRLYDYGRPRELHLEEGLKVSDPVPFRITDSSRQIAEGRTSLFSGGKFSVERYIGAQEFRLGQGWFTPLAGNGTIDDQPWHAGECWYVDDQAAVSSTDKPDILFSMVV